MQFVLLSLIKNLAAWINLKINKNMWAKNWILTVEPGMGRILLGLRICTSQLHRLHDRTFTSSVVVYPSAVPPPPERYAIAVSVLTLPRTPLPSSPSTASSPLTPPLRPLVAPLSTAEPRLVLLNMGLDSPY
jgi:hypothetical protein